MDTTNAVVSTGATAWPAVLRSGVRSGMPLLALILLICPVEAHWIRGGGDNPRCNCSMCQHNRAHRAGVPMDHGVRTPDFNVARLPVSPPSQASQPDFNTPLPAAAPIIDLMIQDEYTPMSTVKSVLAIVHPSRRDVLYDLGCGDGRFLIEAAKVYGCRCVGIEIDEQRAEVAKQKVAEAGLSDRIAIRTADALDAGLIEASATIVLVWQFDDLLKKLRPRLDAAEKLHCVCSIAHPLPWWWSQPRVKHKQGAFYVYRR